MTTSVQRRAKTMALISAWASLLLPATSVAQQSAGKSAAVTLRVQVVQTNDVGVPGAELIVKDVRTEHTARTDSTGNVRLDDLATGRIIVRVRRIGFKDARLFGRVEPGENALTIRLDGNVVTLDEVRIVGGRTIAGRLDEFEARLRAGEANAVVTREQIEKRHPVLLSQMLRGIAGIRLADSSGNIVAISTRGKVMNKKGLVDCVLRMTVDGVVLPGLANIDQVFPSEVHGVEVFFGPARIPPQLGGMRFDTWCGVIAIWTRSGDPPS